MTVSTEPFRATMGNAPMYVITRTTPWPKMTNDTEWVDCAFGVHISTFDEIAAGVPMHDVPLHVTRYRRTRRSFDSRNKGGPEYEFVGEVTFTGGDIATVHGTINLERGFGTFDDMSS